MKKNAIFLSLVLTLLSLGYNKGYSQTVVRQSIGTLGVSYQADGLIVQQSIGQPFATSTNFSNGMENRPGFIQPNEFGLELVSSTFSVQINAYPNPTTYSIKFNSSIDLEDVMVRVFAMDGHMVYQSSVTNLNEWELNCQSWVNGTYLIMIWDSTGNKYQSKIIKI